MPKKSTRSSRAKTKTTSKKRGTITEIRRDWDDPKKVRVSVELPKKKSGKGKKALSYSPEESVVVDKAFARKLVIGDKLDIEASTTVKR